MNQRQVQNDVPYKLLIEDIDDGIANAVILLERGKLVLFLPIYNASQCCLKEVTKTLVCKITSLTNLLAQTGPVETRFLSLQLPTLPLQRLPQFKTIKLEF